jgi:hypothetical protein
MGNEFNIAVLTVDRDGLTGGLQIAIQQENAEGAAIGTRLHGPKYSGTGEQLIRHVITPADRDEILRWLGGTPVEVEADDGETEQLWAIPMGGN